MYTLTRAQIVVGNYHFGSNESVERIDVAYTMKVRRSTPLMEAFRERSPRELLRHSVIFIKLSSYYVDAFIVMKR